LPDYVDYETHENVVIIRLNRPERLNAMGTQVLSEMAQAFMEFERSDAFVAILTGTGRAFSAGMDIKQNIESGNSHMSAIDISPLVNPFFPGVAGFGPKDADGAVLGRTLDKPVIAAINGVACGGGMLLALQADICIASVSATFEMSEVRRGLPIGWNVGYRLNLSHHAAMEIALGVRLSAQRALEVGLVNEVVADDRLIETAMSWARTIASMPRAAVRANRELVDKLVPTVPPEVLALADEYKESVSQGPDSREALMSFYERRPPKFVER
jgi:enoyl-CoA hydratase/carnithine racemase